MLHGLHRETRCSVRSTIYDFLHSIIWLQCIAKWGNGRTAKRNALEFCALSTVSISFMVAIVRIALQCIDYDFCAQVLQHDDQNIKALFRRGMAHRKLNALKMAKCDMLRAQKLLNDPSNPMHQAIARELKLLSKDQKRLRNKGRSKHRRNRNSRTTKGKGVRSAMEEKC